MGVVVAIVLLALPVAHHVIGHNARKRFLRAVHGSHGPEVPLTQHEQAHAARSRSLRLAVDAAWLIYLVAAVVVVAAISSCT